MNLIDRIRKDIQDRLDAVLSEADKLRKALSALGPTSAAGPARDGSRRSTSSSSGGSRRAGGRSSSSRRSSRSSSSSRSGRSSSSSRSPQRRSRTSRAPAGATRNRVLETLSDGRARTAGEVAEATGLARGTVSTTLSKLARAGDVVKAERGYRLPMEAAPGATVASPATES